MKELFIEAEDGLQLSTALFDLVPGKTKGIVLIIHGAKDCKERYYDFAQYLNDNGYVVVISDIRGHGKSINKEYPLGHLDGSGKLLSDINTVITYVINQYKEKPLYIYGHCLGSILARLYILENDYKVNKLLLTGTVQCMSISKIGLKLAKISVKANGPYKRSWLMSAFNHDAEESFKNIDEDNLSCNYHYDNSAIYTLWEITDALHLLEERKTLNPGIMVMSINGAEDPFTGSIKGLEASRQSLKSFGLSNVVLKEVSNVSHDVLHSKEKDEIYSISLSFFNEKNYTKYDKKNTNSVDKNI